LQKYFYVSDDGRRAGGIYVWASRADADRLYGGEWRAMVEAKVRRAADDRFPQLACDDRQPPRDGHLAVAPGWSTALPAGMYRRSVGESSVQNHVSNNRPFLARGATWRRAGSARVPSPPSQFRIGSRPTPALPVHGLARGWPGRLPKRWGERMFWYYPRRRHSGIGYKSPQEFEETT